LAGSTRFRLVRLVLLLLRRCIVVSLTSITLLIAPLARLAETLPLARGSKTEGMRAWRRGEHEAAMRVLLPLAEEGDAAAQNAVGEILLSDTPASTTAASTAASTASRPVSVINAWAPRREAEAAAWFRKAAFQGFPRAQVNLGFSLEQTGRTAARKEAARWYRCAAEQGFAAGQHHLARHFETGDGMPRDIAKAVFWYVKAMNQDYAAAQYAFGRLRRDGIGLPRNTEEAMRLFRLAANQGLEEAQEALEELFQAARGRSIAKRSRQW
jgi:TPR repeat protein